MSERARDYVARHVADMAPDARAKLQVSIDSFFADHPDGDCDECEPAK